MFSVSKYLVARPYKAIGGRVYKALGGCGYKGIFECVAQSLCEFGVTLLESVRSLRQLHNEPWTVSVTGYILVGVGVVLFCMGVLDICS